ncbi:hypothetical protein TWF696_009643 [Orbilia brochopaga]|uniref:Uncharacterized protein n=1 Tax=Orbilia brochopaga TaxID=3140254 RepID=A0AAV9UB73_9PEZI
MYSAKFGPGSASTLFQNKSHWNTAEGNVYGSARRRLFSHSLTKEDLDAYESESTDSDSDLTTESSDSDEDLSDSSSDPTDFTEAGTQQDGCNMRVLRPRTQDSKKRRFYIPSDDEDSFPSSGDDYCAHARTRQRRLPADALLQEGDRTGQRNAKKRKASKEEIPKRDNQQVACNSELAAIEDSSKPLVELTTASPIEAGVRCSTGLPSTTSRISKKPCAPEQAVSAAAKSIKDGLSNKRKQLSELIAQAKVCDSQLQRMASEINSAEDYFKSQRQKLDEEKSTQRASDESNKSVIEGLRRDLQTKNGMIEDLQRKASTAEKITEEAIALRKTIKELMTCSEVQNAATRMLLSFLDKASSVLMISPEIKDAMDTVREFVGPGRISNYGYLSEGLD